MARAKRKKSGATFGSRTDVGCVREHNEDSLAVAPPLYVVCDGMGGHAAGEVASEIAVDVICDRAPAHPDASALGQAVEEANLAIIRAAREGVGRAGHGAAPAPPPCLRRISSSLPRWATHGPISFTKGRCSSSPATTRLWPTLSRPGKLPRPRPGCTPSARSSPALWAATAHPAGSLRNHRGSRRPSASVLRWPFHDIGRRPDRQDPRQPQRAPALRGSAGERGRGPGRLRQRHRHRRGRHGSGRASTAAS